MGPEEVGAQLADAVEEVLPGWVDRSVRQLVLAYAGRVEPEVAAAAAVAGRRARAEVGAEVRALLAVPADEQRTNPLALLRAAVRYPAEVLAEAGVPGVIRDDFDERHFPDDDYGLTPMRFADVDPALHDLGLLWGAVKAQAHLAAHGHKRTLHKRTLEEGG